jgi:1,4-dihydroxy-2-naphthoyl-CoA hydrolase
MWRRWWLQSLKDPGTETTHRVEVGGKARVTGGLPTESSQMSRIKIPEDLRDWNDAGKGYLPGLLGIEFTLISDGEIRARMAVRKALLAWNGFMHAGSVVALADTACGYGTVNSLPADAIGFTTIELKSNFLGTAREGYVECVATPVHRGRTTQVWDAGVRVEDGDKLIAQFRCTQLILRS